MGFLLIIFLVFISPLISVSDLRSIHQYYLNSSALSITSLIFNPRNKYSKWVDNILGPKSVFHPRNPNNPDWMMSSNDLSQKEIYNRFADFHRFFQLPEYSLFPFCSFEILGFGKLGNIEPLMITSREKHPSIGIAYLSIFEYQRKWKCFYRAVYENWRKNTILGAPHYWPILFYCPSPSKKHCQFIPSNQSSTRTEPLPDFSNPSILESNQIVSLKLDMELENSTIWSANFSAELYRSYRAKMNAGRRRRIPLEKNRNKELFSDDLSLDSFTRNEKIGGTNMDSLPTQMYSTPLAICVAVPYSSSSSDPLKSQVNDALLFEFLRYHSALGMKILLFDRNGLHLNSLSSSSYVHSQQSQKEQLWNEKQSKITNKQQQQQLQQENQFFQYNNNKKNNNKTNHKNNRKKDFYFNFTNNLHYHPFTMRELLVPEMKAFKYDNTEPPISVWGQDEMWRRGRHEMQGHDKTLTFTLCRFEALASLGTEHVMVMDFDEFLFCPAAAPDPLSQATYLSDFIEEKKRLGVDQVMFMQRVIANLSLPLNPQLKRSSSSSTTSSSTSSTSSYSSSSSSSSSSINTNRPMMMSHSALDCFTSQLSLNQSLFSCLAPYRYFVNSHSFKSLHLSLSCPLTGYHHSCPGHESPRSHDCLCENWLVRANVQRPPFPFPFILPNDVDSFHNGYYNRSNLSTIILNSSSPSSSTSSSTSPIHSSLDFPYQTPQQINQLPLSRHRILTSITPIVEENMQTNNHHQDQDETMGSKKRDASSSFGKSDHHSQGKKRKRMSSDNQNRFQAKKQLKRIRFEKQQQQITKNQQLKTTQEITDQQYQDSSTISIIPINQYKNQEEEEEGELNQIDQEKIVANKNEKEEEEDEELRQEFLRLKYFHLTREKRKGRGECEIVHVSTKDFSYTDALHEYTNPLEREMMKKEKNELWKIVNYF